MATLLQLRDALALRGQADATQLSAQLSLSSAMTQAMLERLIIMGQVERIDIPPIDKNTINGGCKHCPQNRQCRLATYRLIKSGH